MQKLRKLFLLVRAIPKTVYFNFHYLPFKQAVKLPVLISHHVILRDTKGKVLLSAPSRPAMIRIGFSEHVLFSDYKLNSTWSLNENGMVVFEGTAFIANGTRFFISGRLTIGNNLVISASAKMQCFKEMTFGKDILVGWDCIFMDSDGHAMLDKDDNIINDAKPVFIGDHCWIGAKTFIAKGVSLARNTVVAANSVVLKSVEVPNQAIGGYPAKIIKSDVRWRG